MRKSSRYNRAALLIAIRMDLDRKMVTEESRSTMARSYPRLLRRASPRDGLCQIKDRGAVNYKTLSDIIWHQ